MNRIPGYAGQGLRIDLGGPTVNIDSETPAVLRQLLGGTGLGARVIYEEVPGEVMWSDPENRLILASGPLTATKVRGSSTLSVVTKGALTNGATSTQTNGYFAAYLKQAGFDSIIIQGRAPTLSYLFITPGKAELRDARHLAGEDTWRTDRRLKTELGLNERNSSVLCIGPAGENRVRFAAIFNDCGHVAAHNGVGAVMGSKNLKAIVVTKHRTALTLHDDARLTALANQLFEITRTDDQYSMLHRWGTLHLLPAGARRGRVPFKNYTTSVCPMTDEQLATFSPQYLRQHLEVIRRRPCFRCSMHHCSLIRIPEGPLAGEEGEEPEYEGYTAMGTQLGIWNGLTVTALCNEVDRLGLDINESGWLLGWVMECYQKGIISPQDTDGLDMQWGNVDTIRHMLHKIARRDGCGDWLADGVMRAAAAIGGEAPQIAIHTLSGNTPLGHDHRGVWSYLLDISVANTGCYELHLGPRPDNLGLKMPEPFSATENAEYVARAKWVTAFFDSLGICRLPNREFPQILAAMVSAATGWDFDEAEAEEAGYRAINLLRCFNIRHGHTPQAEAPSPRYGSVPSDGPYAGRDVSQVWDEMLAAYYRYMGWDRATGKPLPATLNKLGLHQAAQEMWPPTN